MSVLFKIYVFMMKILLCAIVVMALHAGQMGNYAEAVILVFITAACASLTYKSQLYGRKEGLL